MTSLQLIIHFPKLTSKRNYLFLPATHPTNSILCKQKKIGFLPQNRGFSKFLLTGKCFDKDGIFERIGGKKKLLVVKAKQGLNSDNGGWDKSDSSRVLGNLALLAGLTYLTVNGKLGWLLDALVSLWLLAFLLPIVGLGAFFWFAGRDIIQSNCPNCGNNFQILKSSMKDGLQFCPYCTQPFSVQGDKFERESTMFSSKRSTETEQVFNESFTRSQQRTSATTIVDIEAEVKDIE